MKVRVRDTFSRRMLVAALLTVPVLCLGVGVSSASALEPWWTVSAGTVPSMLPAGGEGEIVVDVVDVGDASVEGAVSPYRIVDALPGGVSAKEIYATAQLGNNTLRPLTCVTAELACEGTGKVNPYELIEMVIKIKVSEGGVAVGALNRVSVAGGGAPPATLSRPVHVGAEGGFGIEEDKLSIEEEGGAPPTQAGSHPFQVTSTITLNRQADGESAALAKDINVRLPAGMIGDPLVLPECPLGKFLKQASGTDVNECPGDTAIGMVMVHVYSGTVGNAVFPEPLFNLEPAFGEPARFGFNVIEGKAPVVLDTSLRSNGDYGIDVGSFNITQTAAFRSSLITVWGSPGDPRHNSLRGWGCLHEVIGGERLPCEASSETSPASYQTLPTSCEPLHTSIEADSWLEPLNVLSFPESEPMGSLEGCSRLRFTPTMSAQPTTTDAASPSGLNLNINFEDEELTAEKDDAQSDLKNTTVVLPEGLTIDPSAGVGLRGCTEAEYKEEEVQARSEIEQSEGKGCPDEAKLGTVSIETPLLKQKIEGNVFIAQPYANQFGSLVAIYIVAGNPETGVLVKLAGKVTPNPVTGRLTTTFENNPQLPFSHFNFHFREGQQAPLITPASCGTYEVQAQMTPWSQPEQVLSEESGFTLSKGSGGGACPSGQPFSPGITAGTENNSAGSFSPLYVDLTRTDADQEISSFSTNLPPGLSGILTGIPYCPEADIEAARHQTGRQAETEPTCPAASQLGHTEVGTGVGSVLAYVPGRVYLAGPWHGDPFSLVSVNSAVVGPFDLGTVVIRFGLRIDPNTAQVSVDPNASEPIPTIIDGIVTHVRDIKVYIDRSKFILNPTSCEPTSIFSTLTSSGGQSATTSSRFQAADCAHLAFKPTFTASVSGKTSKRYGAAFQVKLTYPKESLGKEANIHEVKVELPKQLPTRQETLNQACLATVFRANPAACPSGSRIGVAKALTPVLPVPLEGPAYFVSYGGAQFPELAIVLQGDGVTVVLHSETFISKAGVISATLDTVPDEPVESFELTLPQGHYSALGAATDLCQAGRTVTVTKHERRKVHGHPRLIAVKVKKKIPALAMPTRFVAQNGAEIEQNTAVTVTGCQKVKKAKAGGQSKPRRRG